MYFAGGIRVYLRCFMVFHYVRVVRVTFKYGIVYSFVVARELLLILICSGFQKFELLISQGVDKLS